MATFSATGSYQGHLRLRAQVDVGDPGPSTTSVNVRLRVWVGTDGWNINDDQRVSFSGWKSGSNDFRNDLSSGEKLVVDRTWSHSVGSSQVNRNFSASLSGNNATGSSPSVFIAWHVDKSPAQPPDPPSWSSMTVQKVSGSRFNPTFRFSWGNSANNHGSGVNASQIEIDNNDNFFESPVDAVIAERHRDTTYPEPGGSYAWRVRMRNDAGWGPWRTKDFSVPYETPEAPTFDSASSITQTGANLWWFNGETGGSSPYRSRVQIRKTSDNVVFYDADFFDEGRFRSTGVLEPNTTYQWRVAVMNAAGWSDFSSWFPSFKTLPSEPKNRPNLSVAVISPVEARMSWTYTASAGEAAGTEWGYQVSTNKDFSGTLFESGFIPLGTTQFAVDGLTPLTQYYFRVRRWNSVGFGPWSAVKSLSPPQGVRVYLNGAWEAKNLYYWDGSEWAVPGMIRGRSGGAWVDAS